MYLTVYITHGSALLCLHAVCLDEMQAIVNSDEGTFGLGFSRF